MPTNIGQLSSVQLFNSGGLSLSPYPIVVASVREKELHKVVKGLACKKCSVKERIYVAQNITNPISYNHWHEEETRGLRTILDQLHLY